MASHGRDDRGLDPGIRVVLGELRDLRAEMRADRQRADEDRRQERLESEARFTKIMRESDERFARARRESEARYARIMRDTQRAWRDLRTVGLSIVKTLNHHTRILERIERRLGEPGGWRPGHGNGRGGQRER